MYWLIPAILLPLLGLALYVPRRIAGRMRSALLIKCALSVGFILYALAAAVRSTQVGELVPWTVGIMLFTTAGMVFSLLGDIWLDLKDMHLDFQKFYMFCGFSCFMICHIIFVVGMLLNYNLPGWALPVALGVGLLIAAFNIVTERPMNIEFGPYRWIVVAYSFVIGIATVLPLAYAIQIRNIPGHSWQPAVFAIGMVLFLASDLVLSQIYFQQDRIKGNRPINYILNYIFYFGAQYTLALSLFFLPIPGSPLQ